MGDGSGNMSAAMRMLKAVAGELRDLANDTARFGETLSEHRGANTHASIHLLQKFDFFAQSLAAHAVLIDSISARLEGGAIDCDQLDELLRHVPFFSVRERIRAVVKGVDAVYETEASSEDWYLGD